MGLGPWASMEFASSNAVNEQHMLHGHHVLVSISSIDLSQKHLKMGWWGSC